MAIKQSAAEKGASGSDYLGLYLSWKALVILTLSLPTLVHGELLITEIMSSSDHDSRSVNGDWFELSNTGTSGVNVGGLGFADSLDPLERSTFPSFTLAAGASLIVLREDSAVDFRSTWQIPTVLRIFERAEFTPEVPGLSSAGETLYLFAASGAIIDQFEFGPATGGRSFARFQDGGLIPGGLSTIGTFGARESQETPADIASPGTVAAPAPPLPPEYLGEFGVSVLAGTDLAARGFAIQVSDPNGDDVLALTVIEEPEWLTVGELIDGSALLSGTPGSGDVGEALLVVELSDGTTETNDVRQIYQLHVHATSSPIILNEFNAVDPDRFLGGTPAVGEPASADTFFGRVLGNGGDWIEFVVTGDGGPGLIDASGWTIEIGPVDGGVFTPFNTAVLTEAPFWKDLPSGTILTLSAENTDLSRVDNLATQGFASANIDYEDSTYLVTDATPLTVGPNNTAVRILDREGRTLFGPAGEGIAGLAGVSDTEILELEDDPAPTVTGLSVEGGGLDGYDPGSTSSTFGAPNLFADTPTSPDRSQNFSAFVATPFERWVRSFGIATPTAATDTDSDGASDFAEFLFGGDPTDGSSKPVTLIDRETRTVSFDIRPGSSPAGQEPVGERSTDLQDWVTTDFPLVSDEPSPLGASYRRRSFQYNGSERTLFFRAFSEASF